MKRIGVAAFCKSGLREIHIPDDVEELCDKSFQFCTSLALGDLSSLKRVGNLAFHWCDLTGIFIPDGVDELWDQCFSGARNSPL